MNGRSLFGATAGSLAFALLASSALAQVETITVTAQKREESIQEVPIAISAYSGDFLAETGTEDVFDLQFYTPGLTVFQSQAATRSGFQIRGVGTSSQNFGLESSVGLFVDGVYRSRQDSLLNDLVDIERIEVLRGPQGTLFGKNTAAGALTIHTAKPEFEFGGFVEGQVGNFGLYNVKGAVTGPLVEDKLAIRVAAFMTQRDGHAENVTTGGEISNKDRYGGRAQLLFTPNENLEVRLIADYATLEENCCYANTWVDGPSDFVVGLLGGQVGTADELFDRKMYANIDPLNETEDYGFSAEVNWDIPGHTLTSITGLRYYEAYDEIDSDFTSADLLDRTINDVDQDAFSQEIRLANDGEGKLRYVVGAYYLKNNLDTLNGTFVGADANAYLNATTGGLVPLVLPEIIPLGFGPFPGLTFAAPTGGVVPANWFPAGEGGLNDMQQEHTSWALFGQMDYDLTERLTATVGLRYTSEKKEMVGTYTETIPLGPSPLGAPAFVLVDPFSLPGIVPIPGIDPIPEGAYADGAGFYLFPPLTPTPDITAELDDTQLTYTAKLTYAPTDNSIIYASYGRGYKSGGINTDRVPPLAPLIFDAETNDSYEIGYKGDFADGALRLNAAVFYTQYDDFQSNTFVGTGFFLQNAGELDTKGAEVEIWAAPTDWLFLTGAVSYLDATYGSFETGPCQIVSVDPNPNGDGSCDRTGDLLSGAPKWTLIGTATAERDLGFATGFLRGEINHQTEQMTDTNNDPLKLQGAITLVNLRGGFRNEDRGLEFTVWAKNLFDEEAVIGSFDPPIQDGKINAYLNEPRTYGATLRKRF